MVKRKSDDHTLVPASSTDAFPNGYGRIVSGELNYLVRQMMETGPDAVAAAADSWPVAHLTGKTVEAEVIFTPQAQNPQVTIPEDQVDAYRRRMLYLIASMDDLTADTWDAIICRWVATAKSPEAKVWVSVEDILSYRGLASHVNGGKRGGFTSEQKAAVTESLLRIMSMRLQVFSMTVLEEQDDGHGGRQVLPVHRQIGGPALEVGLDLSQTDFLGRTEIKALLVRPGEMFARYYMGAGRPVALLSQKALTYRQRKEDWEKRLTRYFAYSWDRRSHEGVERQRHTVSELLKTVHQDPNPLRPEDSKEHLEKALNRLTADRVIAGWDYVPETWDESNRPARRWLQQWLDASIDVLAPEEVKQFYGLALPTEAAAMALAPSLPPQIATGQITGEAVSAIRQHFGLSQVAFAQAMGVTRQLINMVESGQRSVSKKLQAAITEWLEQQPGI